MHKLIIMVFQKLIINNNKKKQFQLKVISFKIINLINFYQIKLNTNNNNNFQNISNKIYSQFNNFNNKI